MDVLNKGSTTPPTGIYGIADIANIYNEVAAAAKAAGNPNLRLYTNEYNVLRFSPSSVARPAWNPASASMPTGIATKSKRSETPAER